MISLELEQEGYEGIPAVADALDEEDLILWADTKDAALIPYAIAMIKGLMGWGEGGDDTGGADNGGAGGDNGGGGESETPEEQGGGGN